MGRTNYFHGFALLVFLAAVALVGMPVIEFVVAFVLAISVGAALLYAFLGFLYGIDWVIDFVFTAR